MNIHEFTNVDRGAVIAQRTRLAYRLETYMESHGLVSNDDYIYPHTVDVQKFIDGVNDLAGNVDFDEGDIAAAFNRFSVKLRGVRKEEVRQFFDEQSNIVEVVDGRLSVRSGALITATEYSTVDLDTMVELYMFAEGIASTTRP